MTVINAESTWLQKNQETKQVAPILKHFYVQ
jgi:hypothetical protein